MQRLLAAFALLLLSVGAAKADALVRNIAGNTTLPCAATAFYYVDQNGTDTKLACNTVINNSDLGTGVKTWFATPSLSNWTAAVTGLGTNVGTFLGTNLAAGYTTFAATPSSANLATLVTDETGSGALVFGTSPTIASPTITGTMALGTSTISGNFTVSGVPVMTGLNAGTIAAGKYMGLDALNNIVLAAGGTGGSTCPSVIDTWDGTTDKTVGATTGILITTGATPIAAPRVLTLPTIASYTLGCTLVVKDLVGIFNSTGTVTPTRASTDTIDGLTTGTALVVASDRVGFDALATGKWGQWGVGIAPASATANQFLTNISAAGVQVKAQPSSSNLSDAANVAMLNVTGQTVTGGANTQSNVQSTGNITVNCGLGQQQYIVNGGAFTITAPAADGNCILDVENNASAGAVTLSGFSPNTMGGATLTTTNGQNFRLYVSRVHGHATIDAKALQ